MAQVHQPSGKSNGNSTDATPAVVSQEPNATAEELFAGDSKAQSEIPTETLDPLWNEEKKPETSAVVESDLIPAAPLAAAWKLGSKWSLAVCILGKGYGKDRYAGVYEAANEAADQLQVTLPPFPDSSTGRLSEREKLTWAVDTLLKEDGPPLAYDIYNKHSLQHRALFELAVNSHVLLLDLSDREDVESLAIRIHSLGRDSRLPEGLWQPVVNALRGRTQSSDLRAQFNDLKVAVQNLHREAASYLESSGAQ